MPDEPTPTGVVLDPAVQIVSNDAGKIWVLLTNRQLEVEGIEPALLHGVIAAVAETGDLAVVRRMLSGRFDQHAVEHVLGAFDGILWRPADPPESRTEIAAGDIVIIGNGGIFEALRRASRRAGVPCRAVRVESFASGAAADRRTHVLWETTGVAGAAGDEDEAAAPPLRDVRVDDLAERCAGASMVICALEALPVQSLFDVQRACADAGLPCLYVTPVAPDRILVGPTAVAGITAVIADWLKPYLAPLCDEVTVFPLIRLPKLDSESPLLDALCAEVAIEAARIANIPPQTRLAARLIVLSADGDRNVRLVFPSSPGSAGLFSETTPVQDASLADLAGSIGQAWIQPIDRSRSRQPEAYRSVGIIGGGTAGYLTALALRARRPELEVTLIESSKIPVIGVGEASTPDLVRFLHSDRFLGLDIVDFFRRVQPAWKLGIKFFWGLPGDHHFMFPFQRGRLLESQLYEGDLNHQSLGALLMESQRAPIFARRDGAHESHLGELRWSYHLDNRRFVRYLGEEALRAGVRHLDCVIEDAAVAPDGETIECLIAEDGRRLKYDLYVDCSGFRSMLLEKKLGSPFVSYQSTLMTDTAIAAGVPHDGVVKPFTLAETMDAGWCWNIPFEDEDHRGYVFSSAFMSVDQAADEMRRKNPAMRDPFTVRFRSGRHEHFWKGNVIAIGNSYAFVEPLESTAIHMIVLSLDWLAAHFPASRDDTAIRDTLNRRMNERWDSLRWFLGMHYRFNRKFDTAFWRAANADVDISGMAERLRLFQERAPLSYQRPLFYTQAPPEFFSDDHSLDTILMGQQVPARYVEPDTPEAWAAQIGALKQFSERAMGQREALALLRERPEILAAFVTDPTSWLHGWLPT